MWKVAQAAALLTSVGVFGCQHPSAADGVQPSPGVQPETSTATIAMISSAVQPEMTFEQVLQIAKSRAPEAKAQLEQVRDHEANHRQITMLARRILNRWDDESNTYYSRVPQLLESTCIDTEQVKAMYPGEVVAKRVYVEIRVDAQGNPVSASVMRGIDDKQVKEAVVHSLMQQRYVPAKENDTYIDATLTIECRLEVR